MLRIRSLWAAALMAVVLALPTTTALAAHLAATSPQQPHYLLCSSTAETDNIQVNNGSHNPFWDDLGNQWIVYYDIQRDTHTNQACDMRVDVRIFNPAPDGSWHGDTEVFADLNGSYIAASDGVIGGSGTYQAHFVWRGPWFGGSTGSYRIQIEEYNGNTAYTRAYTNFSL